ncbi:MAG: cob(I)yrinic acid a,c-diamide adenosyltransferase [Tannerella sp.]|jgi:cob(I)alamin adenosyltransferase|nr:cob(I)yrinic acid a,c-diamide adenosyltransferase [Tannerella sp.]
MEKSKIYTKGGDKGTTSLVGGFRVPKTHPRLEAYGTVDELNSFIGLLIVEGEDRRDTCDLLQFVQSKLFTVGSYLATDPSKTDYKIESQITGESIKKIEDAIDRIDGRLPKLKSFVLPGGSRSAALAHVCRTVCRRAERNIYHLAETETVEEPVLVFMNRLSDLLFVIARSECLLKNGEEIFWNNTCK